MAFLLKYGFFLLFLEHEYIECFFYGGGWADENYAIINLDICNAARNHKLLIPDYRGNQAPFWYINISDAISIYLRIFRHAYFQKTCRSYSKFEELCQDRVVENIFNHSCSRPGCVYHHYVVLLKELCVLVILDNCDHFFKF